MRATIQKANAAAGADAITIPAGTYTLPRAGANEEAASSGDLDLRGELTITGATSVACGVAAYSPVGLLPRSFS